MKVKSKGVSLKLIGGPYEKGWKITKKATCVYEREYAPIKGRSRC